MIVFIQIGTNDGNDNFRRKVIEAKPDLVLLVEPNAACISKIQTHYKNIPNVHIHNRAIYYNNDDTVTLSIPAMKKKIGNKGENGYKYSDLHYSLLPMNNWGSPENMHTITSKTITFDTLCDTHNITEIEFLQIDTEGFDSEIIRMINFSKYKIKMLRFEKWIFDPSTFTRYNSEKASQLGKAGYEFCVSHLSSLGYQITNVKDKDGDDCVATLLEN